MQSPLDPEAQKIAAQIRNDISHARVALEYEDLDGAGALSAKAGLLLLELRKECSQPSEKKPKLSPI